MSQPVAKYSKTWKSVPASLFALVSWDVSSSGGVDFRFSLCCWWLSTLDSVLGTPHHSGGTCGPNHVDGNASRCS